jgi:P-type Ca2+ transporter type 2C
VRGVQGQTRKILGQDQVMLLRCKGVVSFLRFPTPISAGLWLLERRSALPYEAIAIFAIVLLNALMG